MLPRTEISGKTRKGKNIEFKKYELVEYSCKDKILSLVYNLDSKINLPSYINDLVLTNRFMTMQYNNLICNQQISTKTTKTYIYDAQ
jgi:hypothetical protein